MHNGYERHDRQAGQSPNKLDRVLQLKVLGQLLSYNTTFDLEKLYASPLIFRHAIQKKIHVSLHCF